VQRVAIEMQTNKTKGSLSPSQKIKSAAHLSQRQSSTEKPIPRPRPPIRTPTPIRFLCRATLPHYSRQSPDHTFQRKILHRLILHLLSTNWTRIHRLWALCHGAMLHYKSFELRAEVRVVGVATGLDSKVSKVLWERWIENVVWVKG